MPILKAPKDGVAIRMFRQGHGDCFLLAFPRSSGSKPYYVLIDCGMKPGSEEFLPHKKDLRKIVTEDVHGACGGRLDLVILTHEHQDHLNGIWSKNDPPFENFEIEEAWMAWTEDPDNQLANKMRKRHRDQLLGLVQARKQLAAAAGDDSVRRIDQMLSLELGDSSVDFSIDAMFAAAADPEKSVNKQGMKLVKDKAMKNRGCFYLSPGGEPLALEDTKGVRAFVLGPPESETLIADEDPHDDREGFPRDHSFSFTEAATRLDADKTSPFRRHYCVPLEDAFGSDANSFFGKRYGDNKGPDDNRDGIEVGTNPSWRRIDGEWLFSAETLALKLNAGINNTSLVLAFELPDSKKVLFFAADAQRGNWFSWKDVKFKGADGIDARDLLSRTVLYKVGHHCSHNATLAGTLEDAYANLSWMAQGDHADEFVAMITAVYKWATTKNNPPWIHPLRSIKEALVKKAQGRVLQTDENGPAKPPGVSAAQWKRFTERLTVDDLYFDLVIRDQ